MHKSHHLYKSIYLPIQWTLGSQRQTGYIPERNGLEKMEFPGTFCIEERDMESTVYKYILQVSNKEKRNQPHHRQHGYKKVSDKKNHVEFSIHVITLYVKCLGFWHWYSSMVSINFAEFKIPGILQVLFSFQLPRVKK